MTAGTRLAAVATKLTPLERARLALRAHFAGETLESEGNAGTAGSCFRS